MIAIGFSKQQKLDTDPKAMHQINFTTNIDREGNRTMFFFIKEARETILDFSHGTVRVLWMSMCDAHTACSTNLFYFNIISV